MNQGLMSLAAGFVVLLASTARVRGAEPVDFARDVQPIFKATCYECHGAQKQKGGLRLDSRELTMKGGSTGKAIVAGNSKESYLVARIKGEGDEEQMPVKKPALTPAQIAVISKWIDEGAQWPDQANVAGARISKHWAYEKPVKGEVPAVGNAGWARSPIDAFVLARLEKENLRPSAEATRETLIRRVYLDLIGVPPSPAEVRAFLADGDSHAYEKVVGRLLASEHFGERWARVWLDAARYADTNGYEKDGRRSMWPWRDWVIKALNDDMPFDQFTIEQIAGDLLPNATQEQKVATGFHRNAMTNEEGGVDQTEARWLVDVDRVNTTGSVWLGSTITCAQCHNHKYDPFSQKEFYGLMAFFENARELTMPVPTPEQARRQKELSAQIADAEKAVSERKVELNPKLEQWDREQTRAFSLENAAKTQAATKPATKPATMPGLPKEVVAVLRVELEKRDANQQKLLKDFFRGQDARYRELAAKLDSLKKELAGLPIPSTLAFSENPVKGTPRTHVRIRGNYLNKADEVEADVPAVLNPWPAGEPRNRLGLARWLVSRENPLTARVHVNRIWEHLFGRGLVETSEDFGTQGERPVQQDVLDWLAMSFMENGWSQKALLRTIVTSATYRQSSKVTPGLLEKDPYNRLLARGPRFRIDAELLRDVALAASGQLSRKMWGPPVMPPQPEGIWNMPYSGDKWVIAEKEDRFRRGIYTFWRRTAPYPMFTTFDAPSREFCAVSRVRTNTPLQALALMNDEAFFDAARAMAQRVMKEGGDDVKSRASYALELVTARAPKSRELDQLARLHQEQLAKFTSDEAAAKAVANGYTKLPKELPAADAAAWTMVCNVLLNLDEAVTKE
jgi:mono/diheme cytochrome c family protein